MAIAAAYHGVKAVFKDVNMVDSDLQFDVVLWKETGGAEIGLIIVPGYVDLYQPANAPVPSSYYFAGYAYCPN